MTKTVIFDIDNTLYNYDQANTFGMRAVADYCSRNFGLEGQQLQEYYKKAWRIAEDRVGSDSAAIHNRMLRFQCMMELLDQPLFPHVSALYHAYWDTLIKHMEPSPGIIQFCQRLKKARVRIGIGTDMTAYIQYRKLETLGLLSYIDMVVTSEEAGVEKPHPKFFRLCVEKAGCAPEECAFIGDNLEKDVKGSIACGLRGVWYCPGKTPEQETAYPVIVSFETCSEKHFDEI